MAVPEAAVMTGVLQTGDHLTVYWTDNEDNL